MNKKNRDTKNNLGRGILGNIRGNFLAGLIVIAPIGFTIWIVMSFVSWIDGWVLPLVPYNYHFADYLGLNLKGIGVIFFFKFLHRKFFSLYCSIL